MRLQISNPESIH